jgi:hypothetical protein
MLDGISNFEWKKGGKLGQLSAAPIHWHRVAFKIWLQFMQRLLRKTP